MVSNGQGGMRMAHRKRKQVNNKTNPKKFKNNFRSNNGAGFSQAPMPRDQQRDFACDYIDFETFDAYDDSTQRSAPNFHVNPRDRLMPEQQWDRPMRRSPPNLHPFRDSRPLLPLPSGPGMYGTPRRHLPPPMPLPPMAVPPMIRPPMPMLPPRPLMRRPFRPPPPPFIPPVPLMHGPPRPPMHGTRMGRGGLRGPVMDRKFRFAKGSVPNRSLRKGKKKVSNKPTPPQELNDMTKPWITDEIKEANTKKIELNKIATKTADPKDWKAFWEAREKVKTMVQAARLEYIGSHPDEEVEKTLTENLKVDDQNGDLDTKTETGNIATVSQTVDQADESCVKVMQIEPQSDTQSAATNVAGVASPSLTIDQIKTECPQVNEQQPAKTVEPIQNSEAEALQAVAAVEKEPLASAEETNNALEATTVLPKTDPIKSENPVQQPETPVKPEPEPSIKPEAPKPVQAAKSASSRGGGGRGGNQRGRGNRGRGGNNAYNTRTTRSMGGNYNKRGYY